MNYDAGSCVFQALDRDGAVALARCSRFWHAVSWRRASSRPVRPLPSFDSSFDVLEYTRWQARRSGDQGLVLTPMQLVHASRCAVLVLGTRDVELVLEPCNAGAAGGLSHTLEAMPNIQELRKALARFSSVRALRFTFQPCMYLGPRRACTCTTSTPSEGEEPWAVPETTVKAIETVLQAWASRIISLDVDASHWNRQLPTGRGALTPILDHLAKMVALEHLCVRARHTLHWALFAGQVRFHGAAASNDPRKGLLDLRGETPDAQIEGSDADTIAIQRGDYNLLVLGCGLPSAATKVIGERLRSAVIDSPRDAVTLRDLVALSPQVQHCEVRMGLVAPLNALDSVAPSQLDQFASLASLPHLRSLRLDVASTHHANSANFFPYLLAAVTADESAPHPLSRLEHMVLTRGIQFHYDQLCGDLSVALAARLPALRSLRVNSRVVGPQKPLPPLVGLWQQLTHLSLPVSSGPGDSSHDLVYAIATELRKLQSLHLALWVGTWNQQSSYLLTDALVPLVLSSSSLTSVTLTAPSLVPGSGTFMPRWRVAGQPWSSADDRRRDDQHVLTLLHLLWTILDPRHVIPTDPTNLLPESWVGECVAALVMPLLTPRMRHRYRRTVTHFHPRVTPRVVPPPPTSTWARFSAWARRVVELRPAAEPASLIAQQSRDQARRDLEAAKRVMLTRLEPMLVEFGTTEPRTFSFAFQADDEV